MQTQMQQINIVDVLQKAPQKRTTKEILMLQNETKNIQFFKQYIDNGDGDGIFLNQLNDCNKQKCIKNVVNKWDINSYKKIKQSFIQKILSFQRKHKNEQCNQHHFNSIKLRLKLIIYKIVYNSTGSKFYLILEGTVGVYIRLPRKRQESVEDNQEQIQDPNLDLVCVKELNAGTGFGELALMNNKPRLASIICHTNCHFATLDKKEFTEILKDKEEEKLIKEMGFFANLPFFRGWNFNLVKMLYLNSMRVNFVKGDKIYKEGSEPLAVYLIESGEFVFEKSFQKIEVQSDCKTPTSQIKHLMAGNKKATKQLKISVYTSPELFGEEEIMEGQDYRKCTAVCNSAHGQCIMIKKRDFAIRILHEEGALQYLKERLAIKNERMKEKLESINKQIDTFKNYIYDDPKDFKKQTDFQKMYRTYEGRQQLDTTNLKELKDILQGSTTPKKKKKKIKDSSQPDINFYEEGLIKSQTQIDYNILTKEEENKNEQPVARSQSPDKERKVYDNALQNHFLDQLQKHVQKQKKQEIRQQIIQSQQNLSRSNADISRSHDDFSKTHADLSQIHDQRPSQQILQSQPSLQKFSSFSKFDGMEYSPTQHKINKTQLFLGVNTNINKTHVPLLFSPSQIQNDSSIYFPALKSNKYKLQQSLLKPPNMVMIQDNDKIEGDLNLNKRRAFSSFQFKNAQSSQSHIQPSDQIDQKSQNNYHQYSQSQTEFPDFQNEKNMDSVINSEEGQRNKQKTKKGMSLTQISMKIPNYTQDSDYIISNLQITNKQHFKKDSIKESEYLIKIQSEDNKESIQNEKQIYEQKSNILPSLQPPTLFVNFENKQKIITYPRQPSREKQNSNSHSFHFSKDQQEHQQYDSLSLYKKSSYDGISKSQGNLKYKRSLEQLNDIDQPSNTQINFPLSTNSQNKIQQRFNNNRHNAISIDTKLNQRSISAIIQENLKNINPAEKNSFIRSSRPLNDSSYIHQQISPTKGFGRSVLSLTKSPTKLQQQQQQYKFQIQHDQQSKKNDISIDKQNQAQRQKVKVYEAIHQNPKQTKSIKDSLKDHNHSINYHNYHVRSPKSKLLPIKISHPFSNSTQNSPFFSKQNDNSSINQTNIYQEINSPIRTQKHQLFLQQLKKNEHHNLYNDSVVNNLNNNQANFSVIH